eukprot:544827_1
MVTLNSTPDDTVRYACRLLIIYHLIAGIIRDGMGPLVNVYLVSGRGWDPSKAGIIWFIREITMMTCYIPIGDFIDKTTHKKPLIIVATFIASFCSCIIIFTDNFWILAIKSVCEGIAASVLDPGKTGLTLGITGQEKFERQAYQNEIANQSGYLIIMAIIGVIAYFIFPNTNWLFIALGVAGIIGAICIGLIPKCVIKHDVARNLGEGSQRKKAASYKDILTDISTMMWIFTIFSFHFANAAVMPLIAQLVSGGRGRIGVSFGVLVIIIPRLIMIPAVWFAGKYSTRIGYKKIICAACLTLTVRCIFNVVIPLFVNDLRYLCITQLLDFPDAIIALMIITLTKILTEGTGRYNVTIGMCHTAWMLGGSCSQLMGGFLVNYSYQTAFIVLGVISFIPSISTWFGIKEPVPDQSDGKE